MRMASGIAFAMLASILLPHVSAQPTPETSQQKLLSRRAAEADAYRKLAEAVKGVLITSDTYVKDFVAESDEIRAELDEFIRDIRLGEPAWYPDLSCEVPAEVTVARVVEELQKVHQRHYDGDRITGKDIEDISKRQERKVIKVIGLGAPRADLPPGLPEGVAEKLQTVPPHSDLPFPPLWQSIPANARWMAVRAARTDAMRKLVERIKGLRVSGNTTVRDFIAESDQITARASGRLLGASEVGKYFHDNEWIVEVTVEVPTEVVVSVIRDLETRSIQGGYVRGSDIEQLSRSLRGKTFQATGMGIPDPRYVQQASIQSQSPVATLPAWATDTIQMDGQGIAPPEKAGTPQGKLLAARAAEIDAKRRLVEYIRGLEITSDTSIKDLMANHDEVRSHVDGILVGTLVEKTVFSGDEATVTVRLPGMAVWDAIQPTLRRTAKKPAN